MAWYPKAIKKPISIDANDPRIHPIGLITHVDAGNSPDLFNFWQSPGSDGLESHFHAAKKDNLFQYRDNEIEADANLKANSFIRTSDGKRYGFTSMETQGFGTGEWTDFQLQCIKDVYTWGHQTFDWPYRVCPGPFAGGLGYHTMWGAPSQWTPVSKSCPGNDRIAQFHDVLVPWLASKHKVMYTVKDGDTWRSIARDQEIGTFDLYNLNNDIKKPVPGTRIRIK
jgi:hypothetical protein